MKVVTFASGSSGNCSLVRCGDTNILVDVGISMRRICQALARQGLRPADVQGILITHEHTDHISGLPMMVKHHGLPVFAPRTVANRILRSVTGVDEFLCPILPEEPFAVGNLRITAFSTSHDTEQSVGYRTEGEKGRLGYCTDTGCVTGGMQRYLPGCDTVVLECNHDVDMLRAGPYPWHLKQRVMSDRGHLSNECCAAFACKLAESGTNQLILAHLSRENNRPSKAGETVCSLLRQRGHERVAVSIAPADGDLEVEIGTCSE
jgi:phosphoribosyl 1,2-cyclic phosphodiesterase